MIPKYFLISNCIQSTKKSYLKNTFLSESKILILLLDIGLGSLLSEFVIHNELFIL